MLLSKQSRCDHAHHIHTGIVLDGAAIHCRTDEDVDDLSSVLQKTWDFVLWMNDLKIHASMATSRK